MVQVRYMLQVSREDVLLAPRRGRQLPGEPASPEGFMVAPLCMPVKGMACTRTGLAPTEALGCYRSNQSSSLESLNGVGITSRCMDKRWHLVCKDRWECFSL